MSKVRLGILGSTRGTDMLALISAIDQHRLSASINIVISNKKEALILEHAKMNGLPAAFISPLNLAREAYDKKIAALLSAHHVDLVILIGYMRILSAEFICLWPNKIINVHPSLLPAFAGGLDLNVHQAVLDAGVKKTGCTVHFVTENVDEGPIIIQQSCDVLRDDTAQSLKERVQELEGEALIAAIKKLSKSTIEM